MANPLKIAPPPPRRPTPRQDTEAPPLVAVTPKFAQVKEDERVQFNKRVTRRVADGFELLAICTHRKVPELLAEALEMMEERYGKS